MITPKVGLTGQYYVNGGGGGDGPRPGVITAVNGDGTVNMARTTGSESSSNVPFVDVGGTTPTPGVVNRYFQAIDAAS